MLDALIIGGGFYGVSIASYLVSRRGFRDVLVVEREGELLSRASYANQARVHNGYHYPRSYTTAYRSRQNFPRFLNDYPFAVSRGFTKLYAIARRNSKVTARQFRRFCQEIGARLEPVPIDYARLFDARLIEEAFLVEECAFDAVELRRWAERELQRCGVRLVLNARVTAVDGDGDRCRFTCRDAAGQDTTDEACVVFNCTYSGLNQLGGGFGATATKLKQEITEMGLLDMPPLLRGVGVTVMDGPFFSAMPFPARGLHSLSHVRYTPHGFWQDEPGTDPYARLAAYPCESRVDRMMRDVARYMPAIQDARQVDSLFEVKTVLVKNENDDGRPILLERHPGLPNCYSILGGKIDNIYDIIDKLDKEELAAR